MKSVTTTNKAIESASNVKCSNPTCTCVDCKCGSTCTCANCR
ncbi:MAG: hypothetical protein ABIN36_00360 [Ferruginibacter sp.]